MKIRRLIIPIVSFMGLLISQNSVATDNDDWTFEVTPYFLAAGLEGETGIRGVTAEVDMSFSDILDNLDSAFMGMATAQKGRWIFGVEGVYFKISDEGSKSVTGSGPLGRLNVNVNGALELSSAISIYSGTAAYRLLDEKTKLDVLGGLRYTKVEADMDVAISAAFAGGSPFRSFALSADGSESWTDAIIGARVIHPVSDNVDLVGYVDVGGGSDSDTYQWIAGVNWEFKEDYTAKFGYRVLDWDYEDKGTVWDMQSSGVYMGLGIRF